VTLPPDGALVEVRWTSHRPRRTPLDLLPLRLQVWVRDHVTWTTKKYRARGTLTTRQVHLPPIDFTALMIDGKIATTITSENAREVEIEEIKP
jgi:hypothetical protein